MNRLRSAFASLTARLVLTAVLLVAIVAALIAGAATLGLHSYLSGRLDRDVQASLGQSVAAAAHQSPGGGAVQPPGDNDRDNRPFDGPRLDIMAGVIAPGGSGVQIQTEDGTHYLDASTIAMLGRVPADGNGHDTVVPGYGEYRVASQQTPQGRIIVGLPTSAVDGPVSQLGCGRPSSERSASPRPPAPAWSSYAASCGRCGRSRRPRTPWPSCRWPRARST
ncbi:hypothetical protein [Nocardioides ungokensis]|uniref:hypothetical protein n=1 Tax=Nocardioides ungokensis TaxID=1643322 RepID=UPI001FE30E3C|nr:hypothetical protein [Nocardioides ungokensis]